MFPFTDALITSYTQISFHSFPISSLFRSPIKSTFPAMKNYATTTTVAVTTSGNPYLHSSPAPAPPPSTSQALQNITHRFESAAKKAETFAGNLYTHLRTSPGVIDVAMTRLDQAARVLADGGCENFFRREFGSVPGEKLNKSFVCYLSTTGGPVMGTVYVSNKRVGFRSDYPVWTDVEWVYYKVVIMIDQILAVNPSANVANPSEKYVQVVTKDGHEFWFMGFIFYDKALKSLYKAISYSK